MDKEILIIIYSCKKKLQLSEELYDMLNGKLENCKVFLMFGDSSINDDFEIIDDKYLILKVEDYYENLREKTIQLFKVIENNFPNIKGCFKCDDDIIPNLSYFNKIIKYILKNNIPYCGRCCNIHEMGQMSWLHKGKTHNPDLGNHYMFLPGSTYASGPLYYLNKETIIKFNNSNKDRYIFSEDTMIGYHLNQLGLYPTEIELYSDYFEVYNKVNFQNVDNKIKKIYVKLHGGLGNQLFQLASAYGLAKENNRILILVYDYNRDTLKHNSYLNVYIDNIFKTNFLIIHEDKLNKNLKQFSELGDIVSCFQYKGKEIITNNEEDIYLNGYFQNEKYFIKYKNDILKLFKNEELINELKNKYIHLDYSFFIHLRRGDYINNDLYDLKDFDRYVWMAYLEIFRNKYSTIYNPHFYILSDDIDFCKKLDIFNNFGMRVTFIENENALNSLYIMSLCNLGGICSNSSFSWWGSYLNENPNKFVIFPNIWIHNGRKGKENDVYFENSVVLNYY